MLPLVNMVYSIRDGRGDRVGCHQPEGVEKRQPRTAAPRGGAVMTARGAAASWLAQGVSSAPLQTWIQDNVVPLILLGIAIILLWIGGRGDNAGVARRSVGLIVGLVALGIAVSGNGPEIGNFLASLITG
jgi:hypothetical protein